MTTNGLSGATQKVETKDISSVIHFQVEGQFPAGLKGEILLNGSQIGELSGESLQLGYNAETLFPGRNQIDLRLSSVSSSDGDASAGLKLYGLNAARMAETGGFPGAADELFSLEIKKEDLYAGSFPRSLSFEFDLNSSQAPFLHEFWTEGATQEVLGPQDQNEILEQLRSHFALYVSFLENEEAAKKSFLELHSRHIQFEAKRGSRSQAEQLNKSFGNLIGELMSLGSLKADNFQAYLDLQLDQLKFQSFGSGRAWQAQPKNPQAFRLAVSVGEGSAEIQLPFPLYMKVGDSWQTFVLGSF